MYKEHKKNSYLSPGCSEHFQFLWYCSFVLELNGILVSIERSEKRSFLIIYENRTSNIAKKKGKERHWRTMDKGVENFEVNQDELIILQQREIEKEVSESYLFTHWKQNHTPKLCVVLLRCYEFCTNKCGNYHMTSKQAKRKKYQENSLKVFILVPQMPHSHEMKIDASW